LGSASEWIAREGLRPDIQEPYYEHPASVFLTEREGLHSEEEFAKAERWLKEQLAARTVEESTARLTRWNNETRSADLVLGTFDYAGKMEQVVADLGLKPIKSSPVGAVRFAMLPGKAAVIGNSSSIVVPVLHY
jgi:hypothetical protein